MNDNTQKMKNKLAGLVLAGKLTPDESNDLLEASKPRLKFEEVLLPQYCRFNMDPDAVSIFDIVLVDQFGTEYQLVERK